MKTDRNRPRRTRWPEVAICGAATRAAASKVGAGGGLQIRREQSAINSHAKGVTAMTQRIALVTGANRGLGLEICRQLARRGGSVVLTARHPDRGQAAASRLQAEGLPVC